MTNQPAKRVRLLAVVIHPQFAVDDGEHLTLLEGVQPQAVHAVHWPNVLDLVAKATADLEARVNAEAEPGT